jgi:hypothetical protein
MFFLDEIIGVCIYMVSKSSEISFENPTVFLEGVMHRLNIDTSRSIPVTKWLIGDIVREVKQIATQQSSTSSSTMQLTAAVVQKAFSKIRNDQWKEICSLQMVCGLARLGLANPTCKNKKMLRSIIKAVRAWWGFYLTPDDFQRKVCQVDRASMCWFGKVFDWTWTKLNVKRIVYGCMFRPYSDSLCDVLNLSLKATPVLAAQDTSKLDELIKEVKDLPAKGMAVAMKSNLLSALLRKKNGS